jgi:hypothetical protein
MVHRSYGRMRSSYAGLCGGVFGAGISFLFLNQRYLGDWIGYGKLRWLATWDGVIGIWSPLAADVLIRLMIGATLGAVWGALVPRRDEGESCSSPRHVIEKVCRGTPAHAEGYQAIRSPLPVALEAFPEKVPVAGRGKKWRLHVAFWMGLIVGFLGALLYGSPLPVVREQEAKSQPRSSQPYWVISPPAPRGSSGARRRDTG